MFTKIKKTNRAVLIMVGMIAGIVAGLLLKFVPAGAFRDQFIIGGVIEICGVGFLNALKMVVTPIVFVSIVCGMGALSDVKQIGRIGVKTVVLYMATTLTAIIFALGISLAFNVGADLDMSATLASEITVPATKSITATILGIIPVNVAESFVTGNMLQILFIAIFFGAALSLAGDEVEPVRVFIKALNSVFVKMVYAILSLAPICVFCLMTKAIFNVGVVAIIPLLKYFGVFLIAVAAHTFLGYGLFVRLLGNLSPIPLFKKFARMAAITFSVSVSTAVLPLSMNCCKSLGASEKVYAFSLPLGATINMDGTAIIQVVSTVFLAKIYGVQLTMPMLLTVILTTLFISIGSPAIPGGSHITMAVILQSIGVPIEGIALIMGFERLAGMTITVLNVMGDNLCAMLVSKSEKIFDEPTYYDMLAGADDQIA